MEAKSIIERLKELAASERFDVLYGPQKPHIEFATHCKILTLPLERLDSIPRHLIYFKVTDNTRGQSYLAVLQPSINNV